MIPTYPKKAIVIHHSLTSDGQVVDFTAIRRYHMSYRIDGKVVTPVEFARRKTSGEGTRFEEPWEDIGYHAVIEMVGGEAVTFFGRPPDTRGAHCREMAMNQVGIGICIVGNYDIAPPPKILWDRAITTSKFFMRVFPINVIDVRGHGEVQKLEGVTAPKTCPGLQWDMARFRSEL